MFGLNTKDILIRNDYQAGETFAFNSSDSREVFQKNLKKMGSTWKYASKPIKYQYNSLGYRTVEFDQIVDNHIAAFGCSYTEGIGLAEDEMWTTKLEKLTGKQVVNLAQGSTGPDFVFMNNMKYFQYCKKRNIKPSTVVIQWSFAHRRTFLEIVPWDQDNIRMMQFWSPDSPTPSFQREEHRLDWEWYMKRYIADNGEITYNTYFYPLYVNYIWEGIGTKVIHWSWKDDFMPFSFFKDYPLDHFEVTGVNDDFARDLAHNGDTDHTLAVNEIYKRL